MRINSGTHIEHKQVILFWQLLLPLHLAHEPVTEVIVLLPVKTRLQALLLQKNVTFTNVLVPQQITVVLPAISRETPEPTEKEELNSLPVGGYLIYLSDVLTNQDFLVDTGASRSVFSHHSSAAPSGPRLLMADGNPVKAWGP